MEKSMSEKLASIINVAPANYDEDKVDESASVELVDYEEAFEWSNFRALNHYFLENNDKSAGKIRRRKRRTNSSDDSEENSENDFDESTKEEEHSDDENDGEICYTVRTKLVNFMAPIDYKIMWSDEAKNELFNSLFGKKCKEHYEEDVEMSKLRNLKDYSLEDNSNKYAGETSERKRRRDSRDDSEENSETDIVESTGREGHSGDENDEEISYTVRTKLVNFMAPIDYENMWSDEAKNELFSSLFGKK